MKKKIITISGVLIALIALATYTHHLQSNREIDVVNSMSFNSGNYKEENISVILNKLIVIESKEQIAENIIQHVLDNDFHTIRFSFDNGYPNALNVSVYKTEHDIKSGDILFSFTYEQADDEIGKYNILQAEHMNLEIHE